MYNLFSAVFKIINILLIVATSSYQDLNIPLYSLNTEEVLGISDIDKTETTSTTYYDPITNEEQPPLITETEQVLTPIKADYSLTHSEPSGDLYSLAISRLYMNQRYEAPQSPFSISWPKGRILYRLTNDNTGEYIELTPDGDGFQSQDRLISALITNSDNYKFLDIYSSELIKDIELTKVDPTTEVEYQNRLMALQQSSTLLPQATNNYNYDSGASYSFNNIVSRDEWGASPSTWSGSSIDIDDPGRLTWQPYYYGVNRAIIHHTTGSYSNYTGTQAVRSIYLYHAITRGWGDIGYNYLIFSDGTIYEGKLGGEGVYGYHAYTEANEMGIGVAMIGDFSYSLPTSDARRSLRKLLAEKAIFYDWDNLKYSAGGVSKWESTSYNVFGHSDSYFWCYQAWDESYRSTYGYSYLYCNEASEYDNWALIATACPGYALSDHLPDLVSTAETYRNTAGTYYELKSVVEDVERQLSDDILLENKIYVTFNLPESTTEAQVEALIPSFSSISSYTINQNTAVITVEDWDNGGYSPPIGWDGWSYSEGSYFPVSEGVVTQMKTLLKIFRLRSDVLSAKVKTMYDLHDSPELLPE